MGEQLSLKAAMPLAEILATCRKNVSNTGPWIEPPNRHPASRSHWYAMVSLCILGWIDLDITASNHHLLVYFRYEEMKKDASLAIHQIADFLNLSVTDEEVQLITQQTSFAAMKSKPLSIYSTSMAANFKPGAQFFREGKSGSGKEMSSEEQRIYVDNRIVNECNPVGLKYE